MQNAHESWIDAVRETVVSYRRMIDAAVVQLSDDELRVRPTVGVNSVAVILRHVGGNLRSRWTDFLTADGEKPNRQRDLEFQDWPGDRASLMAFFDDGWRCLENALAQITPDNVQTPIFIRGEKHTIPLAIERSLAHTAYHVGQIMLVARIVHAGDWSWLTIPPGESQRHNQQNWGSATSRGILGGADETHR